MSVTEENSESKRKSGNRRQAREAALAFLYQRALGVEGRTLTPISFIRYYEVPEIFQSYFLRIAEGALLDQERIDLEIASAAENWKISRMSKIDLALLRLACFELLHCAETSPQIILDEAIEIAKIFGNSDSAAFVNGVLDKVAKRVRSGLQASA